MKKVCRHCGREFISCPRVKNQQYCGSPDCRRARKREWQARKMADPDYKANQEKAQRGWHDRHPDYWRTYRQEHPESAAKNRIKQRERNRATRHPAITSPPPLIATMDSIEQPSVPLISGRYRLTRLDDAIATMDSIIVEIRSVSEIARRSTVPGP